jgi:serine/threonine-protein kinase
MPEGNETPDRFGRYQVLEELGAGAMGIVYLCVDPVLNRPVAVKVMRESLLMNAADRQQYEVRFQREAEAAGRLTHPDIVQIYDVGPSYLVMEFLEGQALSAFLRSGERITVGRAVSLVQNVADAIDYAHRHGIVHRDVKPANIMLVGDRGVKVMDFGVARFEASNLTAMGTVVGSVRYMSPEQMMGERVDGRADVFSLGAVAYELLTGSTPFPGKTITEVVSRVVHGSHVPPREADERLPESMNAVFARVFASRPGDRYEWALDFAKDLASAAKDVLQLTVLAASSEAPITDPMGAPPTIHGQGGAETAFLAGPGARQGVLLLDSEPPEARAYVDGKLVGATPVDGIDVAFGRHLVRMELPGNLDARGEFEVTPTRPLLALSLSLAPADRPTLVAAHPLPVVAFDPEILPPRRLAGTAPLYPEAARARGLAGTTIVEAWIDERGDVVDVTVTESAGASLDRALLDAVAAWRFAPATKRGMPVSVRLSVRHDFRS